VEGLKTVSSELKDKLNLYLKLFIILYADDTAIMAEAAADLQKQLDSFRYLYLQQTSLIY
jgi:hypothetical protein